MATTRIQLSSSAYTDLGTTPCTIFLEGSNKTYYLNIGSSLPAANTISAVISGTAGGVNIGYSGQNAYVKVIKQDSGTVYAVVMR